MSKKIEKKRRVGIKVCGLTRREDIEFALGLGVDALGFILAESPRKVCLDLVRELTCGLPPFVSRVGVVVNPDPAKLESIIKSRVFDYIQFHGAIEPELLKNLSVKTIKAISISSERDLEKLLWYQDADYYLFDSKVGRQIGGTGKSFDWNILKKISFNKFGVNELSLAEETLNKVNLNKPFILAGGLGPDNIISAIKRVQPAVVDINSQVESSPGIKDHSLLKETIEKIRYLNGQIF